MTPSPILRAILALALSLSPAMAAPAPVNLGETEALKCEEKIASVRRDVLGKYEDGLGELLNNLQKAADLEGALTVRAERTRVAQEHVLSERNFVAEPKALRTLQAQQVAKMHELVAQIVEVRRISTRFGVVRIAGAGHQQQGVSVLSAQGR